MIVVVLNECYGGGYLKAEKKKSLCVFFATFASLR